MFCEPADLVSESDVEQKLIFPLLTARAPIGLGFEPSEILTKNDIRALPIDKGKAEKKLYFPDYAVILCGFPVLVVEAKKPGEDLNEAVREACLYAHELNRRFPPGMNPCQRVIACDGHRLVACAWDSNTIDVEISLGEMCAASTKLETLDLLCGRNALAANSEPMFKSLVSRPLQMPLALLGGRTVRDDEVGHNTFGATLALDYQHVFNPSTREERAFIVKHAYVRSLRRDRYVEPIDRLIRAASPPSVSDATLIEDTQQPAELITALRRHKSLEHKVLLLVGGVGAGKTTFVDHLKEVALSPDLRNSTVWIHLNLNYAPLGENDAYRWLAENMVSELKRVDSTKDFDDIEVIQRVLSVEIQKLRKGPLKLLDASSEAYKTRWVDEVRSLVNDNMGFAKALARYLCASEGKLLIIVLDNCDKRTRDEQLRMFQIAQWAQQEFQSLVFLPIRDVTYDHHRSEPPLNTALKDLVFRIEPPQFARVLQRRVKLALMEMTKGTGQKVLSYTLANGITVEYPRSDQGMYLACILRSLYEHDRLVRRTITGLAGRDIRRAMEIFLEFCTSGHIDEGEIFKIRHSEGNYALPYSLVARVLLRMNRRFYEGDRSYIKNLFQCKPTDQYPDHFARLAVLRWLHKKWVERGPSGVRGYHQVRELLADLIPSGHDTSVLRRELRYLVESLYILTEHQRTDSVADDDLICLSPAGSVHLDLLKNLDYLAACSEELWYDEGNVARTISERIGSRGVSGHYTWLTTSANARDMVSYLEAKQQDGFPCPHEFLAKTDSDSIHSLNPCEVAVSAAAYSQGVRLWVGNLPFRLESADVDVIFSKYCKVFSVELPLDHSTRRPRGFAFVEVSAGDADSVIQQLDGTTVDGRPITVKRADHRV